MSASIGRASLVVLGRRDLRPSSKRLTRREPQTMRCGLDSPDVPEDGRRARRWIARPAEPGSARRLHQRRVRSAAPGTRALPQRPRARLGDALSSASTRTDRSAATRAPIGRSRRRHERAEILAALDCVRRGRPLRRADAARTDCRAAARRARQGRRLGRRRHRRARHRRGRAGVSSGCPSNRAIRRARSFERSGTAGPR